MHVRAAEILRRHHLAGRRLHQRRPAEKDRALLAHDDGLVRHRRHIGAARRARAHHDGDLRNAQRRHRRLIVEDAAEMLAVGKDLGLVRQVRAAGIDQIDARQPVLARDLLRAQMLLHRHRIIGAALDRRVVADDHAFAALDAADAGDDAGAVNRVVIHAVGGERRQFEKRRARIDQPQHPLARQQLAARDVALARRLASRRARPPRARAFSSSISNCHCVALARASAGRDRSSLRAAPRAPPCSIRNTMTPARELRKRLFRRLLPLTAHSIPRDERTLRNFAPHPARVPGTPAHCTRCERGERARREQRRTQ